MTEFKNLKAEAGITNDYAKCLLFRNARADLIQKVFKGYQIGTFAETAGALQKIGQAISHFHLSHTRTFQSNYHKFQPRPRPQQPTHLPPGIPMEVNKMKGKAVASGGKLSFMCFNCDRGGHIAWNCHAPQRAAPR